MSALGQKRTLKRLYLMSALPPKADIGTQSWNVRFVPKADILHCGKRTRLFDHLVGARQKGLRQDQAERPGGRQINYQLKLGRRLYREVGRFFALEDAVDITSRTSKLVI